MLKLVLASLFVAVSLAQSTSQAQTPTNTQTRDQTREPQTTFETQPQTNNQGEITFNNTDWFGALVNPPCQDECKWAFCDSVGEVCEYTTCVNPCTNETTCMQNYMQNEDTEMLMHDCSQGLKVFEPNCTTPECAYTDCADENDGEVCWVEECTDQCEIYNCTVWYQQDGEWFGEACEEDWLPDVTTQEVVQGTQMLFQQYEGTFLTFMNMVCQGNETSKECQDGRKQYNDFVTGTIPQQEPVPNTEEISQGGAAFADSAMSGLDIWVNNTLSGYTDILFSEDVKEMVGSIVNDTNSANGDPNGNQMALQTYDQVDSTEQVVQIAQSQLSLQNIFNVASSYVNSSGDEGTKKWWNAFSLGLTNNGQQRKGDRNDGN